MGREAAESGAVGSTRAMTSRQELALRRIAALEHRTRLQSVALAVLGALLLAAAATRPGDDPEVLRARAVQMVDAEGRVRAELGVDADGAAGLFVRDVAGRARAMVVHDDEQSGFFALDGEGQVRVGAAQFAHGGGGYALHGPAGKGAAVLYLKSQASLRFYDGEGHVTNELLEER